MKKIKFLCKFFLVILGVCILGRAAFYGIYYTLIASGGETGFWSMLFHGLRLDIAVAGYAAIIPTVVMLVAQWWNEKPLAWIWRVYQSIAIIAVTACIIANIAIYKYWGFPLDSTPLFYLFNSPQEITASLSLWQIVIGSIVIIAVFAGLCWAINHLMNPKDVLGISQHQSPNTHKLAFSATYIVILGLLFVCIRGGFTVASNNVGVVYFSNNTRLNHAAVNPVFSFMESAAHSEDFASKYRFMDDKEATALFQKMIYTEQRASTITDSLLTPTFRQALADGKAGKGPGARVIVVVMESFSRYIMSDGGHGVKGVVPNLEQLSREGLYFTNFYGNSFRTDRGLMAVLSGYPAQPTMSLMKYPHKTNSLYSIARSLKGDGYATQYVFGGDANFTNRRSYLKATGYDNIVSVENYDKSIPRGKWGVDDGELFKRALEEMNGDKVNHNVFRAIQTSSSHEPFEVPYHKLKNERLNAFSYTDSCIGQFIAAMKKRSDWNRTLILFVADHLGCYPEDIDNFQLYRYRIPMIITGGAVSHPQRIATIASQQDIAATLLALLGVSHKEFTFSKDIFDPRAPHFAFFAVPDAMGMVTEDNAIIFDNASNKLVLNEGTHKGKNLRPAQAFLQKMYDDIAKR